ncbi:Uncharacterised protein [Niallia circulans]|jgi:hypothetical protein|uniref:DUF6414 family protein n=1 Tax=Niallia circulans TaxID=1397 RepID=UPI00077C135A|nr:hypothetical protein [Niallia circulans]MDR4317904.1 hypothetical protein [Niallia circulans]MED3840963.1 hypothetical protein [Niallia circulans]MED4242323.1 hypothetical protein [Niallia circulans]MED4250973.1 hypothetical protein [Niallia circulans]QKH62317.1 hypothetical protein FOC77_17530 [Niallia circulans]
MKEILYLDTDLMNSLIAQIDKGIINNFSHEQWEQQIESAGQQTSRGKSAGINASASTGTNALPGFNVSLGANIGNNGNETSVESKSFLDSQKDILNKAFHDYSIVLLIEKLKEKELIKEIDSTVEGDISLFTAPFNYYDFEMINNMIDLESLRFMMSQNYSEKDLLEAQRIIKKKNPTVAEREKKEWALNVINEDLGTEAAIKGFKLINVVSGYFSKTLGNLSIIKTNNVLGIINKNSLRISSEALYLRPDKKRKVTILARVIGNKKKVSTKIEEKFDFSPENLDIVPEFMFDVMLGSFNILKSGDYLVTPIAIFYE